VETALQALILWCDQNAGIPPCLGLIDSMLVKTHLLPTETLSLVARLRENEISGDKAQAEQLLAQGDSLLAQAASVLETAKEH